jgi:HSP20 family protein
MQQEMNRLFNTFFDAPNGSSSGGPRRWVPAMDLVELDDHFILRADLPGLDDGDVKLEISDDVLTLSGERTFEHEDRKEGVYRLERGAGSFSRSLTRPEGVDAEKIAASFDKGVLEVRIPKPEQVKPRRISIQVGDGPKAIEGLLDYCDDWMPRPRALDRPLEERLPEVQRLAAERGRAPVPTTVFGAPVEPAAIERYEQLGAERCMFRLKVERAEEVIPAVQRCAETIKRFL